MGPLKRRHGRGGGGQAQAWLLGAGEVHADVGMCGQKLDKSEGQHSEGPPAGSSVTSDPLWKEEEDIEQSGKVPALSLCLSTTQLGTRRTWV